MILEKLDKRGVVMFEKDYSKSEKMANDILKNYAYYSTGEMQWRVKEVAKRKTKKDESDK